MISRIRVTAVEIGSMFSIGVRSESDAVGRVGTWDCALCVSMVGSRSITGVLITLTSMRPI